MERDKSSEKKIEALRELIYEYNRPRTTRASVYRVRRIAKVLGLSFEDIAYRVFDFSEAYVDKLMEKKSDSERVEEIVRELAS